MCTKEAVVAAAQAWQAQTIRVAQYQAISRGSPAILNLMRSKETQLYGEFQQALEALCQSASIPAATSV